MNNESIKSKQEITTKETYIFIAVFDLIKQLDICLRNFPRHEKFCLSQKLRNTAYELNELIYLKIKFKENISINSIQVKYETLKCSIRLAKHLGYFEYFKCNKVQTIYENEKTHKKYLILLEKINNFEKHLKKYFKK